MDWAPASSSELAKTVRDQTEACLAVYREDPSRVEQDANNELRIAEGGYSDRQLYELLQNAVDAARSGGERIEVRLAADALYVANDGAPFDAAGVRAVMASDLSAKTDDRIGRFGIGFKSILAVTAAPTIYSRTVSFTFDAAWSRETITAAGFDAPRYPTMRLARAIDPLQRAHDAHLDELMSWASTVVVIPLRSRRQALADELRLFPAEFLLFSPHITRVRLVDTEAQPKALDRRITLGQGGTTGTAVLTEGARTDAWRVLRTKWHPSDAVRRDAGRVADREALELAWAVPRPARPGLGTFWAYFPTNSSSTLSGIVNAPWKLSDDRTSLLPGAFNKSLLTEILPGLIADGVAELHEAGRPGAVLDLMPARGKEARSWGDDILNEPVFEALRRRASLPDSSGILRLPSDLRLMPEALRTEWVEEWSASGLVETGAWAHPDTGSSAERRLKARRLVGDAAHNNPSTVEWLEHLVAGASAGASERAILLASRILRESSDLEVQNAVLRARILRLEDGSMVRPLRGKVFVRASADDAGRTFVDHDLAERPGIKEALASFGVTVLDKRGELQHLLVNESGGPSGWAKIWPLARELSVPVAKKIFQSELSSPLERSVLIRTALAEWRNMGEALLAGTVIPADGRRDRGRLIDPAFHAEDLELLRELGAVSEPTWRLGTPRETWWQGYENAAKDAFIKKATGSKPDSGHLTLAGSSPPWPLGLLEDLSPEGRQEFTRFVLSRGIPGNWKVQHTSNKSYGVVCVQAPEIWMLKRHGMVATSFGPLKPARALVGLDDQLTHVLPIVEGLSETAAIRIGVKEDPDDFTASDWAALKEIADTWGDDDRRAEFYTWLRARWQPQALVVRVGPRRERVLLENIGVTAVSTVYEGLLEAHIPALLVGDEKDAEQLILEWGMPAGKNLLRQEIVADEVGEPTFLIDEFPPLKLNPRLPVEDYEVKLQHCSRLVRLVATPRGQVAKPIPSIRDNGRVLVTAHKPDAVLTQVASALGLEMSALDVERALDLMAASRSSELRQRIRKAATRSPEEGLVEAVGVDALRTTVPRQALEALEALTSEGSQLSATELARLALAVHGVGILKQHRPVLEGRRLEPPREFSGKQKERQWVADLGFPPEWAGFGERPSPARELVDGPLTLKPLHRYQERVTERIRALLAGIGDERGVVSLPTGAGKTRVTVQALVEEIALGRLKGPIVWIAQSEELCEQAAESWSYVWRAAGPEHPLLLGRLWGSNEIDEETVGTQVVIATDAKLDAITQRVAVDYDWLRDPSVVIVDEAHTSVSPRYTKIFEWLGRGGRTRAGGYLIGLTATPFRGTSEEETQRLVRRYDSNLLDQGVLGENPYRELQDMGVLAKVQRRTIDGSEVEFSPSEMKDIEERNQFPSSTAEALGNDTGRNERIVSSILHLPEDWQVLLFAPSVESARAIAAILSHRGVPSVSVSSSTEPSARRHYIDEFRQGRLRVLTNYQVLTQGFDAPAVRAVYVCRPTFSPNVYQQMVGRGLRGPLNGGSEEVLIVDVEDNLNMYGDRLAFRDFEQLWRR